MGVRLLASSSALEGKGVAGAASRITEGTTPAVAQGNLVCVSTFRSNNAHVRTRRWWLPVLAVAGFPAGLSVVGSDWSLALLGLSIACGMLTHLWSSVCTGLLHADREGVRVEGRTVVRRTRIRAGYMHVQGGQTVVRLTRAFSLPLDVHGLDPSEGEALLRALRLDSSRIATRFAGAEGGATKRMLLMLGLMLPLLPVMNYLTPRGGNVVPMLAFVGFFLGVARCMRSAIFVGADGVLLRNWRRRQKFIPFSDIVKIAPIDQCNVKIQRSDGPDIRLQLGMSGDTSIFGSRNTGLDVGAFVRSVEEGRSRCAPTSAVTTATMLARAGRSIEDWRRALRGAREQGTSYRLPAIPVEQLWRIIEAPSGAAEARAAAAVALSQQLDDAGRARLRVAAERCAAPRLRVALETVAERGDDRAVDDALAQVEPIQPLARSATPLRK